MLIVVSHGGPKYLALAALHLRQSVINFCFCNRNSVADHHRSNVKVPSRNMVLSKMPAMRLLSFSRLTPAAF